MKNLIPNLPCDMTDMSCWKSLAVRSAKRTADKGKETIKDAKDYVY